MSGDTDIQTRNTSITRVEFTRVCSTLMCLQAVLRTISHQSESQSGSETAIVRHGFTKNAASQKVETHQNIADNQISSALFGPSLCIGQI